MINKNNKNNKTHKTHKTHNVEIVYTENSGFIHNSKNYFIRRLSKIQSYNPNERHYEYLYEGKKDYINNDESIVNKFDINHLLNSISDKSFWKYKSVVKYKDDIIEISTDKILENDIPSFKLFQKYYAEYLI